MIAIIQSLNLHWPFYVKTYIEAYSNMGNLSTQIMSFDCLLNDYEINVKIIYAKTLVSTLLPFVIFMVCLLALMIVQLKSKKSQKTRIVVIIIIVSIFLQPGIIKVLFENLNCREIDKESLLEKYLDIGCNADGQKQW